ncbi:MAG: hypothetical protein WA807_06185, partial [Steroidobacteraceae bacterium]
MNATRTLAIFAVGSIALSGCFSAPQRARPTPVPSTPTGAAPASSPAPAPAAPATPSQVLAVPDAIPRFEPRSPYGNPPFYDVFGKRYYVLPSSADYVEIGVASWYGPGFHEIRTSTREPYDM